MSSHIPCTAACISSIVATAIGMYIHARIASSKYDDLRAKKRAQISHAQSTNSEAQKTHWTGDVGHPKTGWTGGGGGLAERRRMRNPLDETSKECKSSDDLNLGVITT